LRYCRNCVLPDTRPNLTLNDKGICNACIAHSTKKEIDWDKRRQAFESVVRRAKELSPGYDCVVPVSGGKDSHCQVLKCLEYGLKPLAVTWRTPVRTEIGQKNLENLIGLGVDHIDYRINSRVEAQFALETFERLGSPSIPMHMAIYNIPRKIATDFGIPLVVWGENPAFEYGGTEEEQRGFELDNKWLKKFGLSHGTTAADWISPSLTQKDLTAYFGPSDEWLKERQCLSIFWGYYFRWDPQTSFEIAKAHGFSDRKEGPKTGLYSFADIDDEFISIHHYLKWHKFGLTRLFDNLSIEIRNHRVSRQAAIEIIRSAPDQTPHEDIETFCQYVKISRNRFFEIAEKFRNPDIWKKGKNGKWEIPGFLIEDWVWT
jgi:N-acetyl sugar amidotransferase